MGHFENYTPEEIRQFVEQSTSLTDFARKIGYKRISGEGRKYLKKKLFSCKICQ